MFFLSTPLSQTTYIPKEYFPKLKKLGILTVGDLLFHFPSRYEDLSKISSISELSSGLTFTIEGRITSLKTIYTWHRKMTITEATIEDETGTARIAWFNQPFVAASLSEGREIRLSGKVSSDAKGFVFQSPVWEMKNRRPTHTGRLVPVYPETRGLTSKWFRWKIQEIILKHKVGAQDPLPEEILRGANLPGLIDALKFTHFPRNNDDFEVGRKRFAFEEMFLLQLKALSVKKYYETQKAVTIKFDEKLIKRFVADLPFKLTDAQRKASFQILKDLEKSTPMNRLLNGDVGSGKTVVAAVAALQAISAGYQAAILAPTEILARQHFESFCGLFKKNEISIALLTGSCQSSNKTDEPKPKRPKILKNLKDGSIQLLIGTHALIQKDIRFKNLALVVIDEQHRFGVAQRAYLQSKSSEINDGLPGKIPHLLSMTATPIPRTLALSFFGNLDLSILDEMPKDRKQIATKTVPAEERKRVYEFTRNEIKKGRQAFVIFPLVEESEKMSEVKAAVAEHENLQKNIFPDLKLGLLHGRLKPKEKEGAMRDFKDGKYDILVSTAVVEVGIDVPNAAVMLIENAERFGLSQLHQFRGRVGRGEHQSYCFLFSDKDSKRLRIMENNSDGFSLAEKDLELRGPGEFLGTQQSGISDSAMQNIGNIKLVALSRTEAQKLLQKDPALTNHPLLKERIREFEEKIHLE